MVSGRESSRFIEGKTTREAERLLRQLASAIEEPQYTSSKKSNIIIATGLTGLAAIVEGCASTGNPYLFGSNFEYPPGAPSVTSDWGSYTSKHVHLNFPHNGLDIDVPRGTPVLVAADGEVDRVATKDFGGKIIRVYHGKDQEGNGVYSGYVHLDEQLVEVGQRVKRGEQIGKSGMTGRNPVYPHLHFDMGVQPDVSKPPIVSDPKKYFPQVNDGKNGTKYLIVCFDPSAKYDFPDITFTYPVKCDSSSIQVAK